MSSMTDYKLVNGDIDFQNGDFVIATNGEATAQRLEQKFKLWQGEWFLDYDAGFPWLTEIFDEVRPSDEFLQTLFQTEIESDPDVKSLDEIELNFEGIGRVLSVTFSATLKSDEQLTGIEVTI